MVETPAPVKEEEKTEVSEETMKEVSASVLQMLEFYFGDSNFGWDRFLQAKVRQGEAA